MTDESGPRFPSAAEHSRVLAARTLHPVADDAPNANPQISVVTVSPKWSQAYVVGGTTIFWDFDPHGQTMALGGLGVNSPLPV